MRTTVNFIPREIMFLLNVKPEPMETKIKVVSGAVNIPISFEYRAAKEELSIVLPSPKAAPVKPRTTEIIKGFFTMERAISFLEGCSPLMILKPMYITVKPKTPLKISMLTI